MSIDKASLEAERWREQRSPATVTTTERIWSAMNRADVARYIDEDKSDLVEALRGCEWVYHEAGGFSTYECPFCSQEKESGHTPECDLAKALQHHTPTEPERH